MCRMGGVVHKHTKTVTTTKKVKKDKKEISVFKKETYDRRCKMVSS